MMADISLDLKGLACPMPVLRASKALKGLEPGDAVAVEVTDPAAPQDFRMFCKNGGHEFISCDEAQGSIRIIIRKAG
jgi:tRNA 2-thiouridine synthesizing protein A